MKILKKNKPQNKNPTAQYLKKNFGKLIQTKPNAENRQHMPQLQQNPQIQEDSINPDLFSDRIHFCLWK